MKKKLKINNFKRLKTQVYRLNIMDYLIICFFTHLIKRNSAYLFFNASTCIISILLKINEDNITVFNIFFYYF